MIPNAREGWTKRREEMKRRAGDKRSEDAAEEKMLKAIRRGI